MSNYYPTISTVLHKILFLAISYSSGRNFLLSFLSSSHVSQLGLTILSSWYVFICTHTHKNALLYTLFYYRTLVRIYIIAVLISHWMYLFTGLPQLNHDHLRPALKVSFFYISLLTLWLPGVHSGISKCLLNKWMYEYLSIGLSIHLSTTFLLYGGRILKVNSFLLLCANLLVSMARYSNKKENTKENNPVCTRICHILASSFPPQ